MIEFSKCPYVTFIYIPNFSLSKIHKTGLFWEKFTIWKVNLSDIEWNLNSLLKYAPGLFHFHLMSLSINTKRFSFWENLLFSKDLVKSDEGQLILANELVLSSWGITTVDRFFLCPSWSIYTKGISFEKILLFFFQSVSLMILKCY